MRNKWNCAIAICCYNRPHYFERCLKSISNSPDVTENKIPVYIFCDGGKEATQNENSEIIKRYSCVADVFYQSDNLCIANHIHFLRKTIFDRFGFDRLMFIEDDIVISPYYYRFMNSALDIYKFNDSLIGKIGLVNSNTKNIETIEQKIEKQKHFGDYGSHINNYIMLKSTWESIKDIMEEYLDKFVIPSKSYREMDFDSIVNWGREKLKNSKMFQSNNFGTLKNICASQDSISNMAMRVNNIYYVSSYVNRILNLGVNGFWSNSDFYFEQEFDKVTLDVMYDDKKEISYIWDTNYRKKLSL
jgi:hypothetical protein